MDTMTWHCLDQLDFVIESKEYPVLFRYLVINFLYIRGNKCTEKSNTKCILLTLNVWRTNIAVSDQFANFHFMSKKTDNLIQHGDEKHCKTINNCVVK